MTRIITAKNLVIEMSPTQWRLSVNGDTPERTLAEATSAHSLRYVNSFANRHQLPENALPQAQIKQVVVGWSEGDQAWHLGLLLAPDLAQARGSRWCELAHWDQASDANIAEQAGRGLSAVLDQPFRLVAPATPTPADIRALPAPPLQAGLWTLQREGETLALVRSQRWMNSQLLRVAWYSLWAVIYIVLSVATLTTKLALPNSGMLLPNPQLLPYLGLVAAAVIIVIVLKTLYDIFSQPGKIVINPSDNTITALRGQTQRWQKTAADLKSVYVSQVLAQRGNKRTLHHGEINLQLNNDRFFNVIVQPREEERREKDTEHATLKEEITPLTAQEVDTDLQAIGVYIAQALGGVPCWYDQRIQ